jgi:hypothetical protein
MERPELAGLGGTANCIGISRETRGLGEGQPQLQGHLTRRRGGRGEAQRQLMWGGAGSVTPTLREC